MARREFANETVLALLEEAPRRITGFTEGQSPEQLRSQPAPDARLINDILGHLRSYADLWGDGSARLLAADHPAVKAIDPRSRFIDSAQSR